MRHVFKWDEFSVRRELFFMFYLYFNNSRDIQLKVKGKGRALDIAPQVTNLRGAQVHGAHKAYLPYTFPGSQL